MVNSVSVLLSSDIKSSMMKSSEYGTLGISDTLAYVFNFKDSLGFVIISNDTRVETPLLAFTKKGSLVNGKTDNPGLKIFLERLEGYLLESIIKSDKNDEQKPLVETRGGPTPVANLDIQVSPLVPVEWGQDYPFNELLEYGDCSGTSNGKVWAGCVATAAAQIMSYWKYPATLGGITYYWSMLNQHKRNTYFVQSPPAIAMVADLFKRIGTGVNMSYDCKGSGASTSKAIDFLVSKGFTLYGSTNLRDYDLGFVNSSLIARRPLIANGCNANAGGGCHAWVIDGVAIGFINNLRVVLYLHNNWGWDGAHNGYYLNGVFDPSIRDYKAVEVGLVYR